MRGAFLRRAVAVLLACCLAVSAVADWDFSGESHGIKVWTRTEVELVDNADPGGLISLLRTLRAQIRMPGEAP